MSQTSDRIADDQLNILLGMCGSVARAHGHTGEQFDRVVETVADAILLYRAQQHPEWSGYMAETMQDEMKGRVCGEVPIDRIRHETMRRIVGRGLIE